MEIKGILLDKDDTLIDLAAFWMEPIHRTVQHLLRDYPDVCQKLAPALEAASKHALLHAQYVVSDLEALPMLISHIQEGTCRQRQRCRA